MTIRAKQFHYHTKIKWLEERKGILTSEGKPSIEVATPPEFNGHEGYWTPEDLFVAAHNSCLLTTFLTIAASRELKIVSFECEAEGLLERPEKKFLFTKVIVRPHITLPSDGDEKMARWAIEHAEDRCLISNSIKSQIVLEPTIVKLD